MTQRIDTAAERLATVLERTGRPVGCGDGSTFIPTDVPFSVRRDAAALIRAQAQEIDRLTAALAEAEGLTAFARPFADALDIECDFMSPPAPFEDGFDARARARSALAAMDTPAQGGEDADL